jgi:hypothetical protein
MLKWRASACFFSLFSPPPGSAAAGVWIVLERQAHVRASVASFVLYFMRFLPHTFLAAYVSYKVPLLTNEFKDDRLDQVFYHIELTCSFLQYSL